LPFVVQILDAKILEDVSKAYGTLDVLPEMVLKNMAGPGPPYAYDGWIESSILRMRAAFPPAEAALAGTVAAFKPLLDERMLMLIQRGVAEFRRRTVRKRL